MTSHDDVPMPLGARTWRRLRTSTADRAAGRRWAVWLFRALIWSVLAGAALLLVRQVVAPSAAEVVDVALAERLAGDERTFPTDQARDAAVREVADAFTFEPDGDADAAAVTAGDQPLSQTVQTITPGRVEVLDDRRATVHLGVRVATVTGTDDEPQAIEHWRWVAVPVIHHDGTVSATDGLVEVPPPPEFDQGRRDRAEVSSSLTTETREIADALFAAWAGDSRAALDALTDSTIPLLANDVDLEEVEAWRVIEPRSRSVNAGPPRVLEAEADVVWTQPGGAQASQTYRVDLERSGDDRWLITDLGPIHPNEKDN